MAPKSSHLIGDATADRRAGRAASIRSMRLSIAAMQAMTEQTKVMLASSRRSIAAADELLAASTQGRRKQSLT
jgi:hypothetical protein